MTTVIALALAAAACTTQPSTTSADGGAAGSPVPTSSAGPTPPITGDPQEYRPEFDRAPCEFSEPPGHNLDCGYLIVPENRADPGGNEVRLHVAIFTAEADKPAPDPIVYLEGGPGGHILEALEFGFEERFAPFLEKRDLIIFDQRGAGLSEPSLACPEVQALGIELLDDDLTAEEYNDLEQVELQKCHDRLVGDGIDLSAYNTAENAADVNDLRGVLGYEEWNLYGISYGTRLALTVMRDHPGGVRSVVLDSTVPLELDLLTETPASAQRAFDGLFAGCAAHIGCAATFPELEAEFDDLVQRLDADPIDIDIDDFVSGDTYPGILRGEDIVELMFQSLYSEELIPLLPEAVADAHAGDYQTFETLASLFFTNEAFFTIGMYLSVQCREEYAFTPVEDVVAAAAQHPDVAALFEDTPGEFEECGVWGAGSGDPVESEAVVSDIPTLIMGGEFDPITPPAFGRLVASSLPNSTFFEFPGLAHGVSSAADCPLAIMVSFVDDPAAPLDGSCIDSMAGPRFVIPGQLDISLVPFDEDFFGVTLTGLVPDGWESQGFGAYIGPGFGDTAIVFQALPGAFLDRDTLVDQYAQQFELVGEFAESTYSDGNRTWDRYRGTDGELDFELAVAEDGNVVLVVIFVAPQGELGDYEQLVLLPALDALQATQ